MAEFREIRVGSASVKWKTEHIRYEFVVSRVGQLADAAPLATHDSIGGALDAAVALATEHNEDMIVHRIVVTRMATVIPVMREGVEV